MNAINTPSDLKPDTLITNPNGTPVISSVHVAAPAADVWKVVGDFGGFEKFIPALASISVIGEGVGSVRHKIFKEGGLEVVEQLNSRNRIGSGVDRSEVQESGQLDGDIHHKPENLRCARHTAGQDIRAREAACHVLHAAAHNELAVVVGARCAPR